MTDHAPAPVTVAGPGGAEPVGRESAQSGSVEAPETGRTEPLRQLLALQDEDVHHDQLAHRRRHLSQQAVLDGIVSRLGVLARAAEPAVTRRAELADAEAELERETADVVGRIALIEQRSRTAAASSYRDQEAMAAEIVSLGQRRSELEERELEVLEECEPLDVELAAVAERRALLDDEARAARAAVAVASAEVDAELAVSAARRGELASLVEPALLLEYERLRTRLDGVGVARLVRGTCSGCHLALPATEIDRLHRGTPGTVAHCDQCGRILVP